MATQREIREPGWDALLPDATDEARALTGAWVRRLCQVTGLPYNAKVAEWSGWMVPWDQDPDHALRALRDLGTCDTLTDEFIVAMHDRSQARDHISNPDSAAAVVGSGVTALALTTVLLPTIGVPSASMPRLLDLVDTAVGHGATSEGRNWHLRPPGSLDPVEPRALPHQDSWGPRETCLMCDDTAQVQALIFAAERSFNDDQQAVLAWALNYLRNIPDPDLACACVAARIPLPEARTLAARAATSTSARETVLAEVATVAALRQPMPAGTV